VAGNITILIAIATEGNRGGRGQRGGDEIGMGACHGLPSVCGPTTNATCVTCSNTTEAFIGRCGDVVIPELPTILVSLKMMESCGRKEEYVDEDVMANCCLIRASADGDVESLSAALKAGASVDVRTSEYMMLPIKAWEGDDPDTPEGEQDEIPPRGKYMGLTPLMLACKEGRPEAVRLLLSSRAMVNAVDEDQMQPLHFAASACCSECVQALILGGADILAQDESGRTAFDCLPGINFMGKPERILWNELLRQVVPSDAPRSNEECSADGQLGLSAALAPSNNFSF